MQQDAPNTTKANVQVDPATYSQRWINLWNSSHTPWDKGNASPALVELVKEKHWALPTGKGIVPGCGRGYDAMVLASKDLHVTGADLSGLAVKAANDVLEKYTGDNKQFVDFKQLDFFNFEVPESKYQVAYDYTFFCAIHPTMREDWGKRYAEIMSPGAHLIVLMYPLTVEDPLMGPPFLVTEGDYHKVLDANFELVHVDPKCKAHGNREGRERISVWKRK